MKRHNLDHHWFTYNVWFNLHALWRIQKRKKETSAARRMWYEKIM